MRCAMPAVVVELLDEIGFQPTIRLMKRWGGGPIYLPTVTRAFKDLRDHRIREEFDGTNYRELSKKYDLTVSYLRKIINGGGDCE